MKISSFNKEKFAKILKKINDSYPSQRGFARISNVNRTYISKYINKKINYPPRPNLLQRIANNSNGLATYDELMEVCGYIKESDEDLKKGINILLNKINSEYSKIDIEVNRLIKDQNKDMTMFFTTKELIGTMQTLSWVRDELKEIIEGNKKTNE